jgi:hypothetical protein
MKKVFLFIFLAGLAASLVFPQDYDIRKLKWGMSFEDVKSAENLGDEFYKQEQLLGIQVEINFGFDYRGLYSVTYSTRDKEFGVKAGEVMRKKYGAPKSDLDYSFLMQSKVILMQHPKEVLAYMEKPDVTVLETISSGDERKLVRNVLTKQDIWQYGNSVALLLNSPDVAKLSYWSSSHFNGSKKKFASLVTELKSKLKKTVKKKSDEADKF